MQETQSLLFLFTDRFVILMKEMTLDVPFRTEAFEPQAILRKTTEQYH